MSIRSEKRRRIVSKLIQLDSGDIQTKGHEKGFMLLYISAFNPFRVPYAETAAVQTIIILATNKRRETSRGMHNRDQNTLNCCGKPQVRIQARMVQGLNARLPLPRLGHTYPATWTP
jgi:hypothetical protein